MELAASAIEAAAARLRGQILATPLVGAPWLPGHTTSGLLVKLEVLQLGGSIWFRGALHALLRELGARRSLAIADRARPALAWATAASMLGFTVEVFVHGPVPEAAARSLACVAPQWVACADPAAAITQADAAARRRGHRRSTGLEDADVQAGVATVGLELAHELAHDCDVIHVAPASLAAAIGAGLGAGDRRLLVRGAPGLVPAEASALRAAARGGLRVDVDDPAALAAALHEPPGRRACAILAE